MISIIRYLSVLVIVALTIGLNHSYSKDFEINLKKIRAEINRDNLQEAIKKLKKIKVENEMHQEKIDLLFGDIYLKINQIEKAEEFYQKNFFTSDENIEALTFIGLAEVRLAQGKLDDAIKFAEQSIKINSNKIRPKIIISIAKTRLGEGEEGFKILNELYLNRKDAEVALAISNYFSAFDETNKAIEILEEFIKRDPNNIKVLNQLASLYLFDGNKEKAIELKMIAYKYYEFNKNRRKQKEAKAWILSIDPNYFDKPIKIKKEEKRDQEEYKEEEITNYEDNNVVPNYEEFDFAKSGHGSGFIIGKGKYIITNHHVIKGAKKIAVRNGIGKISSAKIVGISEDYDLAILELQSPYNVKYSIEPKNFKEPKAGEDVIALGYPAVGEGLYMPMLTQGVISKTFPDGFFITTAAINAGNSGGPIFDLYGNLVGIAFASINKSLEERYGKDPTDLGYAISSLMLEKVFNYEKIIPVNSKKYSKVSLYEKMLPSVVVVAVLLNEN